MFYEALRILPMPGTCALSFPQFFLRKSLRSLGSCLLNMENLSDLDYVRIYAESLKSNPLLFRQQKMLIDSQIQASRSLFKSMLAGPNFKIAARKYLKEIGL